jgi:predicted NBD/HSP70 family sugar kinase
VWLKPEECIVIDVGGSTIRAGFGDATSPTSVLRWPAVAHDPVGTIASAVEAVRRREGTRRVQAVALGCPGVIDHNGRVALALFVPLNGIDLRADLEAAIGLRVIVSNDVDAQAMGDAGLIAGSSFFVISVGTAVGGAHVEHGELRVGQRGSKGEVGHLPVALESRPCPCGGSHCLDLQLSGWALEQSLGPSWWKRPLDGRTNGALHDAGAALGRATRTLDLLLDLDYVLLLGRVFTYPILWQGFESVRTGLGADLPVCVARDTWAHASRGLVRIASLLGEDPSKTKYRNGNFPSGVHACARRDPPRQPPEQERLETDHENQDWRTHLADQSDRIET